METDDSPSVRNQDVVDHGQDSEEIFQIIDETGQGFGFDLTPEVLARPLLIGTSALFGVGMLAGIPIGIAMGRSEENNKRVSAESAKKARVKPTLDGVKFAASAFGLGTLLCAGMGVSAFYALKFYYDVESFEEFGHIMRNVVSERRVWIESSISPTLASVRSTAAENLPGPMQRLQHRFVQSTFGQWVKGQVQSSINIVEDDEATAQSGSRFSKTDNVESS